MIMSLQRQSDAKKIHFLCPLLTPPPARRLGLAPFPVFSLISDCADQRAGGDLPARPFMPVPWHPGCCTGGPGLRATHRGHRCLPGSQGSPEVVPTPQNRSFVPHDTDLSVAGTHSLTGPFRRHLPAHTQCPERRHSHPASRGSDLRESAGHLGKGVSTGPGLEVRPKLQLRHSPGLPAQRAAPSQQWRHRTAGAGSASPRGDIHPRVRSPVLLAVPEGAWSPPCRASPRALGPPGAEATSAPNQDTLVD